MGHLNWSLFSTGSPTQGTKGEPGRKLSKHILSASIMMSLKPGWVLSLDKSHFCEMEHPGTLQPGSLAKSKPEDSTHPCSGGAQVANSASVPAPKYPSPSEGNGGCKVSIQNHIPAGGSGWGFYWSFLACGRHPLASSSASPVQ